MAVPLGGGEDRGGGDWSLLGIKVGSGGGFSGVSCLRRLEMFRWGVYGVCRDGVSGGLSPGPWRLMGGMEGGEEDVDEYVMILILHIQRDFVGCNRSSGFTLGP